MRHVELQRTLRMGGFGFLFYGPFQHFWYAALAQRFPGVSTVNFLSKVSCELLAPSCSCARGACAPDTALTQLTANMVVLGPLVLTTVFTWNLVLTGQADKLKGKLKRDLVPSALDGARPSWPGLCPVPVRARRPQAGRRAGFKFWIPSRVHQLLRGFHSGGRCCT